MLCGLVGRGRGCPDATGLFCRPGSGGLAAGLDTAGSGAIIETGGIEPVADGKSRPRMGVARCEDWVAAWGDPVVCGTCVSAHVTAYRLTNASNTRSFKFALSRAGSRIIGKKSHSVWLQPYSTLNTWHKVRNDPVRQRVVLPLANV